MNLLATMGDTPTSEAGVALMRSDGWSAKPRTQLNDAASARPRARRRVHFFTGSTFVPQTEQNFCPGLSGAPQCVQNLGQVDAPRPGAGGAVGHGSARPSLSRRDLRCVEGQRRGFLGTDVEILLERPAGEDRAEVVFARRQAHRIAEPGGLDRMPVGVGDGELLGNAQHGISHAPLRSAPRAAGQ